MSRDRILIYFLISSIIISSTILLIEIKMTPKYNTKIYADIYNEYNDIFGINNDIQIVDRNSTYTTEEKTTSNIKNRCVR